MRRPHVYRIVRRIKQTSAEHLELRLASSRRSLQCSFSRILLIPSLRPKRRGPIQPVSPKPPADGAYLGGWISTLVTDNTVSLQCAIGWAWWCTGSHQCGASSPGTEIPQSSKMGPLGSGFKVFLFKRINWRSSCVPPQFNSTLDGVGGSQKSWWQGREIQWDLLRASGSADPDKRLLVNKYNNNSSIYYLLSM